MKIATQFTIVPAQPGFSLVLICDNDAFVSNPIIAWKIGPEPEDVWPITEEEIVEDQHQAWAILRPDGKVTKPLMSCFDSLEAFIEEVKADDARMKERARVKAALSASPPVQ